MKVDMHKVLLAIAAVPKTIYFNFRYLSFKDAVKCPIIISHRVALLCMKGKIEINSPIHFNMIRIGFHENPCFDRRTRAVWFNTGKVVFNSTAYIGNGNCIANSGVLTLGDNFQISGNSRIVCKHSTTFGNEVLIGWDCLFMDGDAHKVYTLKMSKKNNQPRDKVVTNENTNYYESKSSNKIFLDGQECRGQQNTDRPITIGNHVWFGAKCIVTKGIRIADGCVVDANSCVIKNIDSPDSIVGGYPAKVIKENIRWEW